MNDPISWPQLPEIKANDPQAEVKKILFQAQLDALKAEQEVLRAKAKAEADANLARETAGRAHEHAQALAVQNAYIDVAKGNLDRATAKANFVQGAAVAISGAYVAVLGLSFVAAQGVALPARGVIPTLFLGLAIFLSAAYSSFITRPEPVQTVPPEEDDTITELQRKRRNSFIIWSRAPTLARRVLLQTAIVSLGIGALLLPIPYLAITDQVAIWLAVIGFVIVVLYLGISASMTGKD